MNPKRACKHCGRLPTPEGYDACLGPIPGDISACCGYGVSEPYIKMRKKRNHHES